MRLAAWKRRSALVLVLLALAVVRATAQDNLTVNAIYLGSAPCAFTTGSGAPSGGNTCDAYRDTSTGDVWTKLSLGWVKLLEPFTSHTVLVGQGTTTAPSPLAGCTNGVLRWASSTVDPICDTNPTVTSATTTAGITLGTNELPTLEYTSNLGSLQNKMLAIYAAELWIETLVAQRTMATIGGRILVAPTNEYTTDRSAQLATPSAPTVTPQGTTGGTTYKYIISALDLDGETLGSTEGSTTTGNAALTSGNNNLVTWSAVTGATSYNVYGRTSGGELFMTNTASLSFTDTGSITPAGALPAANTTAESIYVKYNNFNATDQPYSEANAKVEFYLVNSQTRWAITAVSTGSKTFTLAKFHANGPDDQTSYFTNGETFFVGGSTCNNGTYTVSSSSYNSGTGQTTITATTAPACSTADGGVLYVNTTLTSGTLSGYIYSVVRNRQGSGSSPWSAGDALLDTGTTGNGFIDEYSTAGVLSGSGPTIVGNVRTGTAYNALSPRWAIGNLNGVYGYVADTYGAAFGDVTASNITIDTVNGIRIRSGSTNKIALDASGNASFQQGAILFDSTGAHITPQNVGGLGWYSTNGYNFASPNGAGSALGTGAYASNASGDAMYQAVISGTSVTTSTAHDIYNLTVNGPGNNGGEIIIDSNLNTNSTAMTILASGVGAGSTADINISSIGTLANSTMELGAGTTLSISSATVKITGNNVKVDSSGNETLAGILAFDATPAVSLAEDVAGRLRIGGTTSGVTKYIGWDGVQLIPFDDGTKNLGHPSFRWNTVYATNGTINTSDARQKKNVVPVGQGTQFILGLKPVNYQWSDPALGTGVYDGFLAQDVAALLPTFGGIHYGTDGVADGLNYSSFIAPLVQAFQELNARVAALEKKGGGTQ